MPGTPTCGPFSEGGHLHPRRRNHQVQSADRSAPHFDGITYQKTIGFSNYNAFEVSCATAVASLEVMAGYTYGKSLDDSSSLSEPVYPMGAALTKAISAFDMRHNFVASYRYQSAVRRAAPRGRIAGPRAGRSSGITRFSTGCRSRFTTIPTVRCSAPCPTASTTTASTRHTCLRGNLEVNTNPRNGQPAFNTALFPTDVTPYLGQIGNAPRRFFYGPGLMNFECRCRRRLLCHERTRFSSASRHSTSSITRSSSARRP